MRSPKPRSRYLVKYHFDYGVPVKKPKTYFTSVTVKKEIGEKAAMALAENLWAEFGGAKIKAISAEYQTGLVVRTFQQYHRPTKKKPSKPIPPKK
jgi:hypothetical protein